MKRPSEINLLVEHFGYRDAVKEVDGGWWSSCPVAHSNGDGPAYCGEKMFVSRIEDGGCRFEPTCGHTVDEVLAAVSSREDIGAAPIPAQPENARTLPAPSEPMKVARV